MMLATDQNQEMIRRLKKQMLLKEINARELAERASVGRSFVYDILNGKSLNPTTKKLSAVAAILGVSVPYLLNGQVAANENAVFPEGGYSEDPVISVPSLEIEVTKGGKTLITDDNEDKPYFFRKSWIEKILKLSPEDLRIIFVNGDGMEPTLANGDMVLINTRRTKASPPGIFALFDGEGLQIKRLESISSGKLIKVISDNQQYSGYDAKSGDVDIIGRIVWFARRL